MSVCTSTVTSKPANVDEPSASENVGRGEHADAESAVLLRHAQAEHAELAHLAQHLAGHLAVLLPLRRRAA